MNKALSEYNIEELNESPMNLSLYAVTVLKDKLPEPQRSLMKSLGTKDEYATGYLKFLESKSFWGRIKKIMRI